MSQGSKRQHRFLSQHRPSSHKLPICSRKISKKVLKNKNQEGKFSKCFKTEQGDEDVTCSICMEHPHNAVLLQCSSHGKGCRPYMCATSYRFSNCLDRYKKACSKHLDSGLTCPLCRGHVKSWVVDAEVRKIFDARKRSCMQDKCAFLGTYRELRAHMRKQHPLAQPQAVDPNLEEKWKRMEFERDYNDILSLVMSTMGRGVLVGDYVVEIDSDADGP